MPVYTLETLLSLKDSELVTVPEFKWNEIEKVSPGANTFEPTARRRSSHHTKRPIIMPKAAIPFSQRAMRDDADKADLPVEDEDAEENDEDEDSLAARYLLRTKPKSKKSSVEETDEDGAPVVNLKYAAALAASMKMSDAGDASAAVEEEAAEEDAGWVSVAQNTRTRRSRKGGSFSKWRS